MAAPPANTGYAGKSATDKRWPIFSGDQPLPRLRQHEPQFVLYRRPHRTRVGIDRRCDMLSAARRPDVQSVARTR